MYAIMVTVAGYKEIVNYSLMERTDENLTKLQDTLVYLRAEYPNVLYSIVKIDYEVMK